MLKSGGRGGGEGRVQGGQNLEEKKCKCHQFHPKTDLHTKCYPYRTMGKCSKLGGKVSGAVAKFSRGKFWQKNANVTNGIRKWIYIASFIKIGQWESVKIRGKSLELWEGGGASEKNIGSFPFINLSFISVNRQYK